MPLIRSMALRLFPACLQLGFLVGMVCHGLSTVAQAVDGVENISVRDDLGDGSIFTVDFENNYLPNVVLRENGAASFEALKAQAVAARSFAYYLLGQGRTFIRNSQADQVYSLGGIRSNPGSVWDAAVQATAGEILTFNNILTATFYVAGARPSSPSGIAVAGDPDNSNTERFVTYNAAEGLLGTNNQGSTLGFRGTISNPNYPNRGAMSQNGADVLSDNGAYYQDILKFYYGADIQLELVRQQPGQTPFATKSLTSFETGNESFVRGLTFSGQTRNLTTSSSVERTQEFAQQGSTSQKLTFDYDQQADLVDGTLDGFRSRHLSSVASAARLSNLTSGNPIAPAADPVGNLILPTKGSIGFYLRVDPQFASTEIQVSIAIDEFGTNPLQSQLEQGRYYNVIADGSWHQYEWSLEDASVWFAAFNSASLGDGVLRERFTLDSIIFEGRGDAVVYLDNVFYSSVSAVPEPSAMGVICLGLTLSCFRRRRRE
jgi:hypothetical protein